MQIPALIETLRKKGLTLQIHYNKPIWTLEARDTSGLSVVGRVTEPEFPVAVRVLLQELKML